MIMNQLSDSPRIWYITDNPTEYVDFKKAPYLGEYPVIIPPTIGADIPNNWGNFFVDIYNQMLGRLVDADEIYVIGYSFP